MICRLDDDSILAQARAFYRRQNRSDAAIQFGDREFVIGVILPRRLDIGQRNWGFHPGGFAHATAKQAVRRARRGVSLEKPDVEKKTVCAGAFSNQ